MWRWPPKCVTFQNRHRRILLKTSVSKTNLWSKLLYYEKTEEGTDLTALWSVLFVCVVEITHGNSENQFINWRECFGVVSWMASECVRYTSGDGLRTAGYQAHYTDISMIFPDVRTRLYEWGKTMRISTWYFTNWPCRNSNFAPACHDGEAALLLIGFQNFLQSILVGPKQNKLKLI